MARRALADENGWDQAENHGRIELKRGEELQGTSHLMNDLEPYSYPSPKP